MTLLLIFFQCERNKSQMQKQYMYKCLHQFHDELITRCNCMLISNLSRSIHQNTANFICDFFWGFFWITFFKISVNDFLTIRYFWKGDSATYGQRRWCFYRGRDSAAPPPPPPIWKRKKNFFVSKESTAAILSWLGIRISIQLWF